MNDYNRYSSVSDMLHNLNWQPLQFRRRMDLIHYSFAPLILFRVPYTLNFLPYYLSIADGAGGVGIFEHLVFHCFV